MRGFTLNAKPTLFFGALKVLWSPLYIGKKRVHEVILPNVGLIVFFMIKWLTLELIFSKMEADFDF